MKKILVLNGPNLNMLGKRDQKIYGEKTLSEINDMIKNRAEKESITCLFFQSNHEGSLIDFLQENGKSAHGVLINPGALTHYGYALRDALEDSLLPVIEVHLSDIDAREDFRKINVLDGVSTEVIKGQKDKSYILGLEKLIEYIKG